MTPLQPRLKIEPLDPGGGLRRLACEAIKRAITEMDIYGPLGEIRSDERQLSEDLGVSRTPIREALSVLEQEGLVRSVPRRGIVVVRKTEREIVEMHMRAVRAVTMTQDNRARRSVSLAAHVERYGDFLDAALGAFRNGQ